MATKKRAVKRNKGASKALAAMVRRYGSKKGRQVFYAKASKFARRGLRPSQKANAIYGKGHHQIKRSRKR